ncbi:MAG: Crp/Fnr family transcriptional regulator [Janthinobacterium lividum]
MVDFFVNYLTARGTFTSADLEQIAAATLVKQLKRRQFLLQQGDVCRSMAFVVSGCLRLYRTGDDALEHILRFAPENWWLNDYESFRSGQPAKGAIDALEDTHVLLWSKETWERLKRDIPAFDTLQEHLLSRSLDAQVDRLHTTMSLPAEARYHAFLTSFPGLAQRVPLHMIASYLGVTRKTLGRIRQHTS